MVPADYNYRKLVTFPDPGGEKKADIGTDNVITPGERHRGEDSVLLKQSDTLYRQAQKAHPERWSGQTRNWQPQGSVTLNPEREKQAA